MLLWCGMHRQRAKQSANNCCAIAISDVTLSKREQVIEGRIRWQTEALTALPVTRPKPVADDRRTDPLVVARVRELAPTRTAPHIAHRLNQKGSLSGLAGVCTST